MSGAIDLEALPLRLEGHKPLGAATGTLPHWQMQQDPRENAPITDAKRPLAARRSRSAQLQNLSPWLPTTEARTACLPFIIMLPR